MKLKFWALDWRVKLKYISKNCFDVNSFYFFGAILLREWLYFTADFTNTYLILIDRKFNEEQLLFETFFPKMHIEQNMCTKLIFKFIQSVKIPIKKP